MSLHVHVHLPLHEPSHVVSATTFIVTLVAKETVPRMFLHEPLNVPLQIVCTSKVKVTLVASVTVTSQLIVASSHHSKAAAFSLWGRVRPPL